MHRTKVSRPENNEQHLYISAFDKTYKSQFFWHLKLIYENYLPNLICCTYSPVEEHRNYNNYNKAFIDIFLRFGFTSSSARESVEVYEYYRSVILCSQRSCFIQQIISNLCGRIFLLILIVLVSNLWNTITFREKKKKKWFLNINKSSTGIIPGGLVEQPSWGSWHPTSHRWDSKIKC